jgi:hypothetical protein
LREDGQLLRYITVTMLFCCYLISGATIAFVALGVVATVRRSPVSMLSPTPTDRDDDQPGGQIRAL